MKLKAINKNREFVRTYKKGQSTVGSNVVTYVLKNRYGYIRIGITASKKVGNAVKRNRARRLIRESVRLLNLDMNQGYDLIFVARGKTPHVKMQQVHQQVKSHLEKAGVLHV